jgi:hypothetical protein
MSDVQEAASAAPVEESSDQSGENQSQGQELSGVEGEEVRSDAEINADPSLTKAEKVVEKRIKQLKLKFNGKEYDEELPFEIPDTPEAQDYMRKQLQLAKLSQSKSQEYSTLEKQAVEFVNQLKKNPRAILQDPTIGIDLKKLAAEIIEEEIENSKKSPEQLKLEKAEQELKRIKAEREEEKEQSRKKSQEQLEQQYFDKYQTQLNTALDKSTLPKNEYVRNQLIDLMVLAAESKIDVNVDDLVPIVEADFKAMLKTMFDVSPEDVIEQIVGKENINKVRKKNLAKAKAAGQPPVSLKASVKDVGQKTEKKQEVGEKKSFKDFFGI